jgi:hypothetical protein
MSELRQRGFIVIDGPFSFSEIAEIERDYDHSLAVTPNAQIKRGRASTTASPSERTFRAAIVSTESCQRPT